MFPDAAVLLQGSTRHSQMGWVKMLRTRVYAGSKTKLLWSSAQELQQQPLATDFLVLQLQREQQ